MYFFFSYDERLLSALNFVLMFASSLSILALSPSYEQQMMGRQFFGDRRFHDARRRAADALLTLDWHWRISLMKFCKPL